MEEQKKKYYKLKSPTDIATVADKDLRLKSFIEQIKSDDLILLNQFIKIFQSTGKYYFWF